MSALKLIVQREFSTRVRKKSFLLMTVLMPFLIVAVVVGTLFLAQIKDSEAKKIIVVDSTGQYASHLKSSDYYVFESTDKKPEEIKSDTENEVFGTLIITDNLEKNPQAATFYSEKQPPAELMIYINHVFGEVVKDQKLTALTNESNIDKETVLAVQKITEAPNPVQIGTVRLDADGGEKETSTALAMAIGTFCTLLMYVFILTYGAMVMQGVIEEKSNRIVEVMISSVRPFDLMMGKIIGILLVGITQLTVWCVMGIGLFSVATSVFVPTMDLGEVSGMLNMLPSINWFEILIFFLLFFIGGYLMYASIFAMFGSAVDNPQDSQQFVMPITFIFMFALYAGIYSVNNPDGPLAFWCSIIPLTSPIVMMVRIPFGIPLWEELLSVGILYISAVLIIKMAAKIYRVGILMYGKKPSLGELYKWMRYK